MRSLAIGVILSLAGMLGVAEAGPPACCDQCGSQVCLRMVCRPECETKKVKEIRFRMECEDICLPGRSTLCKKECHDGCHSWIERIWKTSCGQIRTKRKLIAYEVEHEVPVAKCVVEYVCEQCCARSTGAGEP